jgi:hypothetical protein
MSDKDSTGQQEFGPTSDVLSKQLTELNNRARWYSTQLWAVPVAYLGISSVAIAGFLKDVKEYLWVALLACALIGAFVIWHMQGIRDGEKRAVENLQKLEAQLRLPPTAEFKHYTIPFLAAVWVFTSAFALLGVLFLCQQIR